MGLDVSAHQTKRRIKLSQEAVVTLIAVAPFVMLSVFLSNFLTQGDLLLLLKNDAILGTLAVGMGFIVFGRGIDLTMVAVAFAIWLST